MSMRAHAYQRIAQVDVAPTSTPTEAGSLGGHIGSLDDDSLDDLTGEDEEDTTEADDDEDKTALKRKLRSQRAASWSVKLHAFLWVVAAAYVAYAIDVFHVIFQDPRVKKGFLNAGLIGFGINTCITCYLAIYLPYIKKITLEWSVYCPRMIPTASVIGVLSALCFTCAFWPIWGLFTPALLLLFFIGSLMTAHFLPAI